MTYDNTWVPVVYNVLTAAQLQQMVDNITYLHSDGAAIKAGLFTPLCNDKTIYKTSLDAKTAILTVAVPILSSNAKVHFKCLVYIKGSAGGGACYISAEFGGTEIAKWNRSPAGGGEFYGWIDSLFSNYDKTAIQKGCSYNPTADVSLNNIVMTVNTAVSVNLIVYGRVTGNGTGVAAAMGVLVEYIL
jgi:hypothetical protein